MIHRILDAGPGKGRSAKAIKARFPKAQMDGEDISGQLLAAVPSDSPTRVGRFLNRPFGNEFFDAVFCVEALEHAVRTYASVRKIVQLLKLGGQLVVIDKDARKLGTMGTDDWEQWFGGRSLRQTVERCCRRSTDRPVNGVRLPRGQFRVWVGSK